MWDVSKEYDLDFAATTQGLTYRDTCMVLLRFALERYGPRTRSCRRVVVGGGSHFALVGSLFSIRVDCGIYLAEASSIFFDCLANGRVPFGRDVYCFFQLHRICGRTRKHGWMGIHSVDFRLHDPITDLCHSGLRLRPRDMEQIINANGFVQFIAGPWVFLMNTELTFHRSGTWPAGRRAASVPSLPMLAIHPQRQPAIPGEGHWGNI